MPPCVSWRRAREIADVQCIYKDKSPCMYLYCTTKSYPDETKQICSKSNIQYIRENDIDQAIMLGRSESNISMPISNCKRDDRTKQTIFEKTLTATRDENF